VNSRPTKGRTKPAKETRRKNSCALYTTPGGAKKIMLLRRMQVAIPIADQSKLFSMSVLRKAPLCLRPLYCAILGRFVRIRTASVVQAAGHFSLLAVKSLQRIRQGAPGLDPKTETLLGSRLTPGSPVNPKLNPGLLQRIQISFARACISRNCEMGFRRAACDCGLDVRFHRSCLRTSPQLRVLPMDAIGLRQKKSFAPK